MRGILIHLKHPVPLSLFAVVAAVVGIILSPATPVRAQEGGGFCAGDPILTVNGKTVHVIAGVMGRPADVRANVQHAHFKIFLPAGVDAEIVGYTGDYFTESAEIIYDDRLMHVPGELIEMRVEVAFEATTAMPTLLLVSMDGVSQQIDSGVTWNVMEGVYRIEQ